MTVADNPSLTRFELLDGDRVVGKTVIPLCPFTAAFIRRHPEYADLVDPGLRGQFS
jgi:uncharacterized protein